MLFGAPTLDSPKLPISPLQAIVRLELLKPHLQYIIPEAVKEAQQLVEEGVEGAKGRDVASVAVDVMVRPFSRIELAGL